MKTYLKIKGLSLAQEARIIKRLEKSRINPKLAASLHNHRTVDVRREARSTHLALGFLRGTTLAQMEKPYRPLNEGHKATKNMSRSLPDWKRIEQLIRKYGVQYFETEQEMLQRFAEFKDTGSVGV